MIPVWTTLLLATIAGPAIALNVTLLVQKFKGNLSDTPTTTVVTKTGTTEPAPERLDDLYRAA